MYEKFSLKTEKMKQRIILLGGRKMVRLGKLERLIPVWKKGPDYFTFLLNLLFLTAC